MDASIMCGKTKDAGAVSGIRFSPNPIDVARRVMDKSPHIYLSGEGAEQFAFDQEMPQVPNDYFSTDMRYQQLLTARETEKHCKEVILEPTKNDFKFGTVGAVAKDSKGNLAAATSTGGIVNKQYGRIGDSPVIGAGTYANNQTCAVSATGHGEHFLRHVVAFNISSRMNHLNQPLEDAARAVVFDELASTQGSGGVIAVDREGNLTLPFNTEGMYRGWGTNTQAGQGKIYKDI
jgi:beta-aspartyl-peptidase (threonine type)